MRRAALVAFLLLLGVGVRAHDVTGPRAARRSPPMPAVLAEGVFEVGRDSYVDLVRVELCYREGWCPYFWPQVNKSTFPAGRYRVKVVVEPAPRDLCYGSCPLCDDCDQH